MEKLNPVVWKKNQLANKVDLTYARFLIIFVKKAYKWQVKKQMIVYWTLFYKAIVVECELMDGNQQVVLEKSWLEVQSTQLTFETFSSIFNPCCICQFFELNTSI